MDKNMLMLNQYLAIEDNWLKNFVKLNPLEISNQDIENKELLIGNRKDTHSLEEQSQHGFSIDSNGIATVYIVGPITYNYSIYNMFFGWPSITALLNDLELLEESKEVQGIFLILESPGGQASGMTEYTDALNACSKPVVSWGTMFASGAMFIATACDEWYIEAMGTCGSIGVMYSQWRKDTNEIMIVSKNAPDKNADPDSENGLKAIKKVIDGLEATFLEKISHYTGISVDTIIKDWGQGGMLSAQDASRVGMVNGIKSLNETYQILLDMTIKQEGNKIEDTGNFENQLMVLAKDLSVVAEANSALTEFIVANFNKLEAKIDNVTKLVNANNAAAEQETAAEQARVESVGNLFALFTAEGVNQPRFNQLKAECLGNKDCDENAARQKILELKSTLSQNPNPDTPLPISPPINSNNGLSAYKGKVDMYIKEGKTEIDAEEAVAINHPEIHQNYLNAINGVN
jgi:ClpP class serine protease